MLRGTPGFTKPLNPRWNSLRMLWLIRAQESEDALRALVDLATIKNSKLIATYLQLLSGSDKAEDFTKVSNDTAKEEWKQAFGIDPDSVEGRERIKEAVNTFVRKREENQAIRKKVNRVR